MQQLSSPAGQSPTAPTPDSFKGSLVEGKGIRHGARPLAGRCHRPRTAPEPRPDSAQTTAQQNAKGQQLEQLQALLPTVRGDVSIEVEQVDLAA